MHPPQPSFGPIRSPRGLVDVTVSDDELVLRHRDSWRDRVDSDWARGGTVLLAVGLAVGGGLTSGVVSTAFWVLAGTALLAVVLVVVAEIVATAWFVAKGFLMLFTRSGRSRLKRGAVEVLTLLDQVHDGWRMPRSQIVGVSPVEGSRRLTLRLATTQGEMTLRSRDRIQLEGLAWALQPR